MQRSGEIDVLRNAIFAIATVALSFMPDLAVAQLTVEARLAPGQPPAIIASRARGGDAPDNSLAGIQYALDRGVDAIEVYVQPTRDGQYILMFEPRLTDMTNVAEVFPDGAPALEGNTLARRHLTNDYTLDEIAQLRLKDPNGGDHPVATLDAALGLAHDRLLVILVLQRWEPETLAAVLNRHDTKQILIISRQDLVKLRETAQTADVGLVTFPNVSDIERGFEKDLERFGDLLKMVYVTSDQFTPEFLALTRKHGIPVAINAAAYNDEDDALMRGNSAPWAATLESGAAAYLTKHPDAVLELLDR